MHDLKWIFLAPALCINLVRAEPIKNAYYRILSPSGAEESYVLGTVHAPVELAEFAGRVEAQIARSKSVNVERVMQAADIATYAADPISALAKMAVFSGPPVDEATRKKLVEYGVPNGVAARISDKTCGVLGVVGQVQGQTLPLDVRVMQASYDAKVPVKALDTDGMRESARAQQDAATGECSLKTLFAENSVAELRAYFTSAAASSVADYRAGKIADDEELNGPLAVSRNLAWMPAITKSLEDGRAFIAVGQSHLFGHNGLLSLLERRGYTIQEVMARDAPAATTAPAIARPVVAPHAAR